MITKKDIQHIAKLARINISEEEEEKFANDLLLILDYFNSLKEVDVSNVEPSFHSVEEFLEKKLELMREDKEKLSDEQLNEKLVSSALDRKEKYIKIKNVL